MDGRGRFEQDLSTLMLRLAAGMEKESETKLSNLRDWLLKLQKENVVKINHSVMELVCAKYLILKGYDVQLEYGLNDLLTCDLYSTKGYGNLIVEIETGFIPPDHALDPLTYLSARLASKIIRYSSFAGKFALGVPPHYVLPIPRALALPPKGRTPDGRRASPLRPRTSRRRQAFWVITFSSRFLEGEGQAEFRRPTSVREWIPTLTLSRTDMLGKRCTL